MCSARVLAGAIAVVLACSAAPAHAWAPAASAPIHPGVLMGPGEEGGCTSAFVFTDGADVLLAFAAHCARGPSPTEETDDCAALSLPLGTPITIEGATRPGTLVYSSWLTMNEV